MPRVPVYELCLLRSVYIPTAMIRLLLFPALAAGSWMTALADSLWTYVALGASTILTEELAPIFGGIAAHEGELRISRVIIAISLGGWAATTLLYGLGFWKWELIRRRFPKVRSAGTVALRVVRNNPLKASFFVRFAFGLRLVLPMACGAARVSPYVFLPVSLAGSVAWTVFFAALGYAAGEAAVQSIGRIGKVGEFIGALLLTAAVLSLVSWQKRRRERRLARDKRARGPETNDALS